MGGKKNISKVLWALLLVFILMAITLVYFLTSRRIPIVQSGLGSSSDLGLFLLINLNIVVLMVLGFLVVKNIIKLVVDWRKKILGSKLRTKLVLSFVGLSFIPTVLLFLIAKGILQTVMQGWFSPQITSAVQSAQTVAKHHYSFLENQLDRQADKLSGKINLLYPQLFSSQGIEDENESQEANTFLASYLESKRKEYGLSEIALVDAENGEVLVKTIDPRFSDNEKSQLPEYNFANIRKTISGNSSVKPEVTMSAEFLRIYHPLGVDSKRKMSLVVTARVDSELTVLLSKVIDDYDEYLQLKTSKRPLQSTYMLTLVGVTLLIVVLAIWIGFYLARSIVVPIQMLAEGTEQISQGNLDYTIPDVGDDELSLLVNSFNKMTGDLRETTDELVSRRHYMETVLASVGVGVVSIDPQHRIATANLAASEMLAFDENISALQGKVFEDVFSSSLSRKLMEMLDELSASQRRVLVENHSVVLKDQSKHLQITATKLIGENSEDLGAVILFDDLSELVSAQKMAAWREVAKRIAHEIKNPLTPIQLSAQRLRKKFGDIEYVENKNSYNDKDRSIIRECTDAIIKQVDTLRTLVNEFSQFARMPKISVSQQNLNQLIEETVKIFRQSNPQITISLNLDQSIGEFQFDREQIGRVLVNLLDNSVFSINEFKGNLYRLGEHSFGSQAMNMENCEEIISSSVEYEGKIEISNTYDGDLGQVSLIFADNGLGIPDRDHAKIFEPYFTTKEGGTGLGLAIVSSIIADHGGFIRVKNNSPRGTIFTIELPFK
jgi:two-component system, NtrC family, nitrogen regulation sensor histidine kinase NtrY